MWFQTTSAMLALWPQAVTAGRLRLTPYGRNEQNRQTAGFDL
jgi:hypothetical protein